MIFWFGRHRGRHISQVPSDYLWWVIGNLDSYKLVAAAREELELRDANGTHFEDPEFQHRRRY